MRRSVAFLLVFFIGVGAGVLVTNVYRLLRPVAAGRGTPWPVPGTEFKRDAAINDPANEEPILDDRCPDGCFFQNYTYTVTPAVTRTIDLGYECPKYANLFDPSSTATDDKTALQDEWNDEDIYGPSRLFSSYRYFNSANLVIDSRFNPYDPVNPFPADIKGKCLSDEACEDIKDEEKAEKRTYLGTRYYSETGYYKQTGHKGIQTCHWSDPRLTYRITVKGKYKYDQTQPNGFGEADAECSTGFKKGNDPNNATWLRSIPDADQTFKIDETWSDKYIPPHYQYAVRPDDDSQARLNEMTPLLDAKITDVQGPIYGSEEPLPHRFDHMLTPETTPPAKPSSVPQDGFDLKIAQFPWIDWIALEKDAGGNFYPSGKACSDIHTYTTSFNGNGRPLRFVLSDFVQYHEWENCGTLSIRIAPESDGYLAPADPPIGPTECHWVLPPGNWDAERWIKIKDLKTQNTAHPHPYYFDPPKVMTRENWFNYCGRFEHPCLPVNRGLGWKNVQASGISVQSISPAPHSFTAAIAANGTSCGRPETAGQNYGKDECDRLNLTRLFDNPLVPNCPVGEPCLSEYNCPVLGWCVNPASGYRWESSTTRSPRNMPLAEAAKNASFCPDGYCTIPYFCRVKPDTMRGVIIIRLDSGAGLNEVATAP